MNKGYIKRVLSGFLVAAMLFTSMPELAFAEELQDNTAVEQTESAVEATETTDEKNTEIIVTETEAGQTEAAEEVLYLAEEKNGEQFTTGSDEETESLIDFKVENFSVEMDGFKMVVKGKYSAQPKSEDITSWNCQVYLDQYSEDGTLLNRSGINNLYGYYPEVDSTTYGTDVYPAKGTSYVRISAKTEVYGDTTESKELSTEAMAYISMPEADVKMREMRVKATRFDVDLYIDGEINLLSEEYFYVSFVGGMTADETTWQQIGYYQTYYANPYNSDNSYLETISLPNLDKGTTYYGKLLVDVGRYYDSNNQMAYTKRWEIPLASFTTLEKPDCFADLTVTPSPFLIKYQGIVEVPSNSNSYNLYINEYDKNGEFVRKVSTNRQSYHGDNSILIYYPEQFVPSKDCSTIKFSLENSSESVYSKDYPIEAMDITFSVPNVTAGISSISFDVSYEGDLKLDNSNRYYEDFYIKYVGNSKEGEEAFQTDTTYLNFWYDGGNSSNVTLSGFVPSTSYDGKIVIYKEASYSDETAYAVYQEIPVSFTTSEIKEVDYLADIAVDFSSFNATVTGTISRPYSENSTEYDYWFEQYNDKDELIGKSYISSYWGCEQEEEEIKRSFSLCEDTSYVKLNVTNGSQEMVKETDPFVRNNKSRISFAVTNVDSGVASATFCLSSSDTINFGTETSLGFYCNLVDEDGNKLASDSVHIWLEKDEERLPNIQFNGLKDNTTFNCYLEIYSEFYNYLTSKDEYAFYQKIKVPEFTTKENVIYDLTKEIPDDVLRSIIMERVRETNYGVDSLAENAIPMSYLEKISYLYSTRENYFDPAVKDLTGIELLTNLIDLSMDRHEIDSVEKVDWSKLKSLNYLSLCSNNITVFPDLRKNSKLTRVYMNNNCLSAEEMKRAASLVSDNVSDFYLSDQRTGEGIRLITEKAFYVTNGDVPVAARIENYKTGLGYTVSFSVDGNPIQMEQQYYGSIEYYQRYSGLSVGKHTLKASLLAGEKEIDSAEQEFEVVRQPLFAEKTVYSSRKDTSICLNIYSDTSKVIKTVYMQSKKGDIYAYLSNMDSYSNGRDPRYQILHSYNWANIYNNRVYLNNDNYVTPAGTYDIVVEFADGTTEILEDAVFVVEDSVGTIASVLSASNYDDSGEFLYLDIIGWNLKPEKLNYSISQNEKNYPVSYVEAKQEVSNGWIVKLKKIGWTVFDEDTSADIEITAKTGYTINPKECEGYIYFGKGVFYSEFNELTKELEFGINEEVENLTDISVELKEAVYNGSYYSYDENAETIATGILARDGVFYRAKFVDENGNDFDFNVNNTFCAAIKYSNSTDIEYIWAYADSDNGTGAESERDYWSAPSLYVKGDSVNGYQFNFFTKTLYKEDNNTYTVELVSVATNEKTKVNSERYAYTFTGDTEPYSYIRVTDDFSKLADGAYQLILTRNGNESFVHSFEVKTHDAFYLNSMSLSWTDNTHIQVYLNMPYVMKDDDFTVSLEDRNGNKISGITSKVTARYSNSVYLTLSGLSYEKAKTSYYVKVTHKKLGDPKRIDGSAFYSDTRGQTCEIYRSAISYYTMNRNVITGVKIGDSYVPATIYFYYPYDTEVLYSIRLTKDNVKNQAYFFTKEDLAKLPRATGLYDVVVLSDEGSSLCRLGGNIGYSENSASASFSVSIDKSTLFVNGEDGTEYPKNATIIAQNYTTTPTYKSSNTAVVTVAADSSDKGKAVVTAVGVGTATITITNGKETKTINITVNRAAVLCGISFEKENLKITTGQTVANRICILPGEAANDSQTFSVVSDDETVAAAAYENGIVSVTAGKPGTATITVTLNGTDFTTSCKVTVEGAYTEEEIEELEVLNSDVKALTNLQANLGDVELAGGWKWTNPQTKLAADNNLPVQYFEAVYEREDYPTLTYMVPVAITKISGITLSGFATIDGGEKDSFTANISYTGYQPQDDTYLEQVSFRWKITDSNRVCELEDTSGQTVMITAFDAENITKDTLQNISVTATVNGQTFTAKSKFKVLAKPYISEILWGYEETIEGGLPFEVDSERGIQILWKEVTNTSKTFILTTEGEFSWSSADSSVLSVKTGKLDKETGIQKTTVTVKNPGASYLKITARDAGKYSITIPVYVMDYKPILETSAITINPYSEQGTNILFREKNGMAVTDCSISSKSNAISDDEISVSISDSGNSIQVSYASESYTGKKKSGNMELTLTDVNGDTYTYPIKLTINPVKPSVKVKQTVTPNLFYCDATASFQLSSTEKIIDIEMTKEDSKGFVLEGWVEDVTSKGVNYTSVMVYATDLNSKTLASYKAKKSPLVQIPLEIYFEGFEEPIETTLTVKYTLKAPSVKLSDLVLVDQGNAESGAPVVATDATNKVTLDMSDGFEVSAVSNKLGVVAEVVDDSLVISGKKSGTYKVELTNPSWTTKVTASGKLTVAKSQTLVLEKKNVTLNMATNVVNNGFCEIPVSLKGSDVSVQSLAFTTDKNSAKLVNSGYLSYEYDSDAQCIYLGINKGVDASANNIKSGTYKLTLVGVDEFGVTTSKATLSIKLVSKAPAISLTGKGAIELTARATSEIAYTAKLTNIEGTIVEAPELTGAYASYFNARVEDGKIYVSATDFPMSTKITYTLGMNVTLDNGVTIPTTVKIKPVNKGNKVKAVTPTVTLYKQEEDTSASVTFSTGITAAIDDMEIVSDKTSDLFKLGGWTYADGQLKTTVSLSDTEAAKLMKPGKYTLNVRVKLHGAAYNEKAPVVKVTVVVK